MSEPGRARQRLLPGWVLLVALLPGLLALAPQAYGALKQAPPERVFIGFRHAVKDHASYMGLARSAARRGGVTIQNPYTTDPHDGRMVMLYLLLVGQVSALSGLSLVLTWHALGALVVWLFFLLVWRVVVTVIEAPRWRRVTFLLVCFGGGLEWPLFLAEGSAVTTFARAHPATSLHSYWSMFGAAQMPMWLAGYSLVLCAFLLALRRPRLLVQLLGGGLLLIAAFWTHPYTGLAALPVLGLLGVVPIAAPLWRWQLPDSYEVRAYLPFVGTALVAAAGIGAFAWWARQDPVYAATSGNVLGLLGKSWRAPFGLWWYPLMYGAPLLLAVVGMWRARGEEVRPALRLTACWLVVTVALAACPLIPGLKFQYMVFLPLCLFAGMGLQQAVEGSKRLGQLSRRPALIALFWFAVAASAPSILARDLPTTESASIYVSAPQLELLDALRDLPAGNVLAPPSVAVLVPWKSGKPVFDVHWFLTPDHEQKLATLARFYDVSTPLEWRRFFLVQEGISYVIEDPWVKDRVAGLTPPLVEVFRNEFGRIFQVRAR